MFERFIIFLRLYGIVLNNLCIRYDVRSFFKKAAFELILSNYVGLLLTGVPFDPKKRFISYTSIYFIEKIMIGPKTQIHVSHYNLGKRRLL